MNKKPTIDGRSFVIWVCILIILGYIGQIIWVVGFPETAPTELCCGLILSFPALVIAVVLLMIKVTNLF